MKYFRHAELLNDYLLNAKIPLAVLIMVINMNLDCVR